MELFGQIIAVAALVFGFGFVVFFHELGHFLAAKWVGIKVEQFAVGFGHALLAFRKGIGWRVGNTNKEYQLRARAYLAEHEAGLKTTHAISESMSEEQKIQVAGTAMGLGDTEYRLNWMPLGGYVKMLGQDDMNPNAQSDDPRAYNRKSIGARMFVVSAGVIMNIILAAILFMAVFLIGYDVPPAIVGSVSVNSPAQKAGILVGDRVRYVGGNYQHDFNSLHLSSALSHPDEPLPVVVERNPGEFHTVQVRPQRDASTFLAMGIRDMRALAAPDPKKFKIDEKDRAKIEAKKHEAILPGDVIIAVDGTPVNVGGEKQAPQQSINDYRLLVERFQKSEGRPVPLRVRDKDGKERDVQAKVDFSEFFDGSFNIAGLQPRPMVAGINEESPVQGKLKEEDVVVSITVNGDPWHNPSTDEFIQRVGAAGADSKKVDFVVVRNGKREAVEGAVPNYRTGRGKRGFGVSLTRDTDRPIVSSVLDDSAAARAGVRRGSLIVKIDNEPVANWFDIHRLIKKGNGKCTLTYAELDDKGERIGTETSVGLSLSKSEFETLANIRYTHELLLDEYSEPRKTSSPLTAMSWGVIETRDLLLQFYLTLVRLFQGSVSVTNFMGPIGIVHAGSLFAFKGWDWLIWFLAMISANLAVVNFLPIPIVDGGLFTFLILEKVQGKPLSPRMQTVAQLVGLAIILSVFLLVTYQDIARLWL